jgi:hypothetical protein
LQGSKQVEGRSILYVFTIPALPPSFNDWKGWPEGKKMRLRDEWKSMVLALVREKGNVAPRGIERATLRAVLFFATNRRRDHDNYHMPLWKWTQDQLVDSKVLVRDDHERLIAMPPGIVVGGPERTLVTIEEGCDGG